MKTSLAGHHDGRRSPAFTLNQVKNLSRSTPTTPGAPVMHHHLRRPGRGQSRATRSAGSHGPRRPRARRPKVCLHTSRRTSNAPPRRPRCSADDFDHLRPPVQPHHPVTVHLVRQPTGVDKLLHRLGAGRPVPPRKYACAVEREPHGRLAGRHVDLVPDPPESTPPRSGRCRTSGTGMRTVSPTARRVRSSTGCAAGDAPASTPRRFDGRRAQHVAASSHRPARSSSRRHPVAAVRPAQ